MGCKTKGGYKFGKCSGFAPNLQHCFYYTPPQDGVTLQHIEYPVNAIRSGNYNIPGREADRVMHPSIQFEQNDATTDDPASTPAGTGSANCGKLTVPDPCSLSNTRWSTGTPVIVYDYYPDQLSFDYNFSDTWFAYLYDTSNKGGIVGTPCYHIETLTQTKGTQGDTRQICHPCTSFTCTPASTTLSYTTGQNLTNDIDCPHPTLFGIGTNSNKVCFSYDQLSTQLPNGVIDFEVSYDGVTYEDVWDATTQAGEAYLSSQNTWQAGELNAGDFEVYDLTQGVTKVDFIVKFNIEPDFDDSGATTVFNGTRWTPTEILNGGTGYAVGDVFPIQYVHRHPDNSQTTFTLNIKVTQVGPVTAQTSGGTNFDILRVGDTINGHTITRAFHMDLDNFPYHIIYVDGSGNDFVKETQYTSDRNHIITAKAGYGIPDRAMLVGLYEFLDKSIQFCTGDVNRNAPDTFNEIQQPLGFVEIENGRITGVNLSNGVYSFDQSTLKNGTGYASDDNIATSGGTGSGLTVDIDVGVSFDDSGNEVSNAIIGIRVNTPGSGYSIGDEITISGGSAKITVAQITNGGQNWQYFPRDPILTVGGPNDAGTGFQRVSTDDGAPEFVISTTPKGDLNFEIVTADSGDATMEVVSATGGDNKPAKIRGIFVGGVLDQVVIVDGGRGYSVDRRPNISVINDNEERTLIQKNDGYRDDLVDEFGGILSDLPDGGDPTDTGVPRIQESDYTNLSDSYGKVPKETDVLEMEPKMNIKMDPDGVRIDQLPQNKYRKDATEPLRSIMAPEQNLNYLDDTPISQEYKDVIIDDQDRIKNQVDGIIDDITQPKIPEFKQTQETKVETCQGSFTNLPTASTYTKYIMRQYRPDSARQTSIQVTLTMSPVNSGCAHIGCTPPGTQSGYSNSETDPETGVTTTTTGTYSMSPLLGPGCKSWTATGNMTIYHDLTRGANTVKLANQARGNPFTE